MELTIKDAVDLSLDSGNFPDIIPVDYGLDLVLKTKPEYKVKIRTPRKIHIIKIWERMEFSFGK